MKQSCSTDAVARVCLWHVFIMLFMIGLANGFYTTKIYTDEAVSINYTSTVNSALLLKVFLGSFMSLCIMCMRDNGIKRINGHSCLD